MASVTISSDYGFVIMSSGFIAFVQLFLGALPMAQRKVFRGKEFLEQKGVQALIEEHKKATQQSSINNNGYPDMGNGRYSDFLSYEQWLAFNNAQRAHHNMVESSGPALAMTLSVGLLQPQTAAILGTLYGVGRLVYGFGYTTKSGADGRMLGGVISSIAYFGLFGISIYNGAKFAGVFSYFK